MFFLFQYSKAGLPGGLINLHQSLLESITSYFEKGESVKTRVREIRKSLRDAITFAKKKRIYPSSKTNRAAELMEEMYEELELTHKILKEAAIEMENMINKIKEERVINVHSIITEAQEYFKIKEVDAGIQLLEKAQKELKEKLLVKTRKKVFAGYNSELKKLKHEFAQREWTERKNKSSKFFSLCIPYENYSTYKLIRNIIDGFTRLKSSFAFDRAE
ncbi:MAG: hypothetical protein GX654_22225 [Desulfatiglans sp.]|jgi:F0F1-type ATP synthase membrane subunit b/b'|nr:hypothetical protein [Desulfatiglans sp.]